VEGSEREREGVRGSERKGAGERGGEREREGEFKEDRLSETVKGERLSERVLLA